MVRCLVLHDVRSQSQHSSRQRREEIINDHAVDDDDDDGSNTDSGDNPETQVHETQEEEEVYRVIVDDDTNPLNETVPNTIRRGQQRGRPNLQSNARRESNSERIVGGSRLSGRSGSRGGRRRQSFETTIKDTIAGYTEFQRQSLQQLRPGAFDQDDYDEWKKAEMIFLALEVPKGSRFYWACLNSLKELVFWRKYFIDIAESIDEDKLQILEAMTGVSRNNQDVPKQLGPTQSYGSQHSGGISSGSPSSVSNSL